ncbi:MAG: DUF5069 domain-containing protein [Candidatus Eremiobacteraeota bacterium]|nr:DUF5069 domain-containing protein [Candidatus Eremiobacteraeota bacterium]
MEEIVPTISTSAMGPLGIMHLPRLWQKISLHVSGRLPPDYRHGVGGFDELLCERLGIDVEELTSFIERERPGNLALEAWVAEHARDLRPATIAALNQRLRTGNMRDEVAAERRARFGITDETVANGILLNDLDDWAGFHERLTGGRPLDGSNRIG